MSTLIEGFPDEVFLMVLARVPLYLHPRLRLVCRAWRVAVTSVDLLKVRQEVNFIEDFMCVCSREPDKIWQLYDPRHDVWITIPVLPSRIRHLSHFGAVSTAGKLYVLGGGSDHNGIYDGQNRIFASSQVWSYEPVTRRWTFCAPMIMARVNFACGILDGKIIVAGGFGNDIERRPIKQAEMYDPKNDVWIGIPDLLHTHNAPCYGVVVRGKMHVEPWALHHAKPMTRCRGTILGCTPLRI